MLLVYKENAAIIKRNFYYKRNLLRNGLSKHVTVLQNNQRYISNRRLHQLLGYYNNIIIKFYLLKPINKL